MDCFPLILGICNNMWCLGEMIKGYAYIEIWQGDFLLCKNSLAAT